MVGFELPLPNGHGFPDFTDCATNTVGAARRLGRGGPRGGRCARSTGTCRRSATRCRATRSSASSSTLWTFCTDRRVAARRPEPAARVLHREGVSRERDASGRPASPPRAANGRRRTSSSTNTGSAPAASTKWGAVRRAASGPDGALEPRPRRRRGGACAGRFYASHDARQHRRRRGRRRAADRQGDVGLGNGYTVYEPFAMWGQIIGANGFLQMHAGFEIPSDQRRGRQRRLPPHGARLHARAGSAAFGRAWSPMMEVLVGQARRAAPPSGTSCRRCRCRSASCSTCCSASASACRSTSARTRKPQVLTYLLWDWFDGGFFEFWK